MSGVALVLGASSVLLSVALLVAAVLLARSLAATRTELAQMRARLEARVADRSDGERPAPSSLPVPVVTDLRVVPTDRAEAAVVPASRQVVQATLQQPLIRVAVWSAGVRHAVRPESRDRARALARREYRRRSKLRRRAARQAARTAAVSPVRWNGDEPADERAS